MTGATHGTVTEANAHPHCSSDGKFAIAHNGVIENYLAIKNFLSGEGYEFVSDTDTEALVNLIAYHYRKEDSDNGKNRFLESVRKSLLHVEGTYGIAVICADCPNDIVGARKGSPLCLGLGDGDDLSLSGFEFLDVSQRLFESFSLVGKEDSGAIGLDQGYWAVLHLCGRKSLGMNVCNFLELEGAFERNGKH